MLKYFVETQRASAEYISYNLASTMGKWMAEAFLLIITDSYYYSKRFLCSQVDLCLHASRISLRVSTRQDYLKLNDCVAHI